LATDKKRETFSSRLGFILVSAGCAIGLGNVWRFPYITGRYGGGAFVILYLFFLLILGIPIMTVEFAVGRASRRSTALSFEQLEPKGTKWHIYKYFAMFGNYLLMMYYTTISGWMILFFLKMLRGDFNGMNATQIAAAFAKITANPMLCVGFMILVVLIGFGICAGGLQGGVERIVKVMMTALILLMVVLAVNSARLPGAAKGISFYLKPNFHNMVKYGISKTIFAAMGQAFFTLSIGTGSMAIFGSYIDKDKRLFGESVTISALDTIVAILAGLIIFPACFAYGVTPTAGPSLIFITLPNVFNHMPHGQIWGALFFLFMTFAAMSTVIAVFQNIVAYMTDLKGVSVKTSCLINTIAMILLSLPCALGFSVLSGVHPMGVGTTILDFEDFILSNNLMPLGSLVYLLFCMTKKGWGYDGFIHEVNEGEGLRMPDTAMTRTYLTYILPLVVLCVFFGGYLIH
jgi:NSS family neurotransmitter:Na+ symporter